MYKICISKFSWKNVDDLATLSMQESSLLKLYIGGGWLGHQGNHPASATRHLVGITHPQDTLSLPRYVSVRPLIYSNEFTFQIS